MLSIMRRYLPYLSLFHLVHLFGLEKKMAAQYKTDQTVFDSDLTVPVAGTVFYLLLVTVGPKIMAVSQAKRERRRRRPPFLPTPPASAWKPRAKPSQGADFFVVFRPSPASLARPPSSQQKKKAYVLKDAMIAYNAYQV